MKGYSAAMIHTDLSGKKLLLIGGLNNTADLIRLAHRNGVLVGVADYNKNTYLKSIADFSHDISVIGGAPHPKQACVYFCGRQIGIRCQYQ